VRRLLAISLLLLFSFPLVSPVFALAANAGDKLPACCRRNGVHHCAMKMQGELSQDMQFAALQENCPAYPRAITSVQRNDLSLQASPQLLAEIMVHPTGKAQAEARARIALHRCWQQRGPPALHV
jgi:hypothetical protein